LLTMGIH